MTDKQDENWIWNAGVDVVLLITGLGWSIWVLAGGPSITGRELAGAALGAAFCTVIAASLVNNVNQAIKAKLALVAELRRGEHDNLVGTWEGEAGQLLHVRYEPGTNRYWVRGWISDHWQLHTEALWPRSEALSKTVDELELSGEMTPWADEGTDLIRRLLSLPEWPIGCADEHETVTDEWDGVSGVTSENVDAGGPAGGPPAGGPHTPEETAVLRPLGVPVFQTEAARTAYYSDPERTEVINRD